MITVLTTPRTGSTWYCQYLSNLYDIKNLNELFEDPKYNSNIEQAKGLSYLKDNPKTVLKVFPNHLKDKWVFTDPHTNITVTNTRRPKFDKLVLDMSDKIYILTRDFYPQCLSHYIATKSNHFSGEVRGQEHLIFDQVWWDRTVDYLINCYEVLGTYSKQYDCELIDYSELPFGTTPSNKKYIRPVTWDKKPLDPAVNIHSFFNKKGT